MFTLAGGHGMPMACLRQWADSVAEGDHENFDSKLIARGALCLVDVLTMDPW